MKKSPMERRKAPRLEKQLSVQLSAAAFDLTTETKNISSRGVCCEVDRPIPYMSKLRVTLQLPVKEKGRTVLHPIRTEAVVVRSEAHFVALYFERISPSDAAKIDDYVFTNLTGSPSLSSK